MPVEGIKFQLINWTPWKLFKVLVSIIGSPEIVLICMIAFPINEQKVIYSHCRKTQIIHKKEKISYNFTPFKYVDILLSSTFLQQRYVSIFFLYFLSSLSYCPFPPPSLHFSRPPSDMATKPETENVATPKSWIHLWQEHSTPRVKAVFTLLI